MGEPIERREVMWAEMKPYVYGGDSCEEHEPQWDSYAAGDKDGDCSTDPLTLDPILFPPGTKVVVSEPVCPQCHCPPHETGAIEKTTDDGEKFLTKHWQCECDFDWFEWASGEYS